MTSAGLRQPLAEAQRPIQTTLDPERAEAEQGGGYPAPRGWPRAQHPGSRRPVRIRGCDVTDLLGEPAGRPGIAGTAYDTAWLASVPVDGEAKAPRFPSALRWLVDHQLPDGSWGGEVRYQHDRVLCTLAALVPLADFGRGVGERGCVESGTRFLWQQGHLLASEPTELVGFELLLPTLIERAKKVGVPVPPHLDPYALQRAEKLRLLPVEALCSPRTTAAHSLEFLGDRADPRGLRAAQGANGAIGNSPAATAFFLARSNDPRALMYLEECRRRTGGTMVPVLHPCETFELLWAAYHLFLAGVPAASLLGDEEQTALREGLRAGGVSLSPTFPIPDADDTAVALLLLHELGESVDPAVLRSFASKEGYFASFPHERHSSVGVNLHVLHALLRVPGYPEGNKVISRLLDYLEACHISGLYWFDKWHISPYYAVAHALCVLKELPPDETRRAAPMVERSREWIRQTQNRDGSWGFYGQATAEETAYALLGLASCHPDRMPESDLRRCAEGARYLRPTVRPGRPDTPDRFPPLWIDKCLYTPTLVVRAAIEAACLAQRRSRRSASIGGDRVKVSGRAARACCAPVV